jgi:type II secretory pathway component GspD/PulD (secretin)
MKRALVMVALAATLFALPGSTDASPASSADLRGILNRLKSTQINVNFDETGLDEVLKLIGRFTNVNIIVSPKLRNEAPVEELRVSLKLTRISAYEALRIILEFKDLGIVYRHRVLMVTTKEDARGKPVLRMYAISDLTFTIRDFPGPEMELRPAGAEFDTDEEVTQREDPFTDPEFISDLIKSNVEPASWEDDKVSIQATSKFLLVRQSPAVHAKISRLLSLLRAAK